MRRNEGGIFNLDNFDEMTHADSGGSFIFGLVTIASACSVGANVKLFNVIDDIKNNPDSEDLDKLDVSHPSSTVYLTPAVSLIATLAFALNFRSQNAHGKIASRVASGVVSAASIITSGVDLERASDKLYEYITDRDLPEPLSSDAWHAAGFSRTFATADQYVGAVGLMATAFAIYNFMKRDNNQIAPDPDAVVAREAADGAREATTRALAEVVRQQRSASRAASEGDGRDSPPPSYEEVANDEADSPPRSPSSPSSSPSSAADTNNTSQIAPDPDVVVARGVADRALEFVRHLRADSGGGGRDALPPSYEEVVTRADLPQHSPSPSLSPSNAADTNNTNGAVAPQGSLPPLRGQAGRD